MIIMDPLLSSKKYPKIIAQYLLEYALLEKLFSFHYGLKAEMFQITKRYYYLLAA